MTTTLTCDRCGPVLRIETDDEKHLAKKQAEFEQKHRKCKKGANIRAQRKAHREQARGLRSGGAPGYDFYIGGDE